MWMEKLQGAMSSGQQAAMIEKYISGPQKDVLLELISRDINDLGVKDAVMAN